MSKAPRPKSAAVGVGKMKRLQYEEPKHPRYIHDPEVFKSIKFDKSAVYFRNNKVSTCAYIQKKNGGSGKAIAIEYPLEKTGWKNPASYQNFNQSSELQSVSNTAYKYRVTEHAGMVKKKLTPYNPNSYRSRLPVASVVMPYKNSSQLVIGDRTSHNKNHFKTVN